MINEAPVGSAPLLQWNTNDIISRTQVVLLFLPGNNFPFNLVQMKVLKAHFIALIMGPDSDRTPNELSSIDVTMKYI